MLKTIFLLIIALLVTATATVAQDNSEFERQQQQKQQKEAALQQAVAASASAKALKAKVDAQESDVVLEAAKAGDKSLIPYLKLLATDEFRRTREGSAAFEAHIALVKLGEESALAEIFAELDSELRAKNFPLQNSAVAKLVLINNEAAYRKLFELLDNKTPRPSGSDDVFRPLSQVVMIYLGRAVENPPRRENGQVNDTDVSAWKAWFAKNKHLIE